MESKESENELVCTAISRCYNYVPYRKIEDEILTALEKNKVPFSALDGILQDVKLKAGWYSPVQNYHGDSD